MKAWPFLTLAPFVLTALAGSLAPGATTACAAEPRIVGEWRFSGTAIFSHQGVPMSPPAAIVRIRE